MKVSVKILKTGENLECEVEESDTVQELVNEVKEKLNIPGIEIKLVYASRLLKADESIASSGITDKAQLHATVKEPKTVKTEAASVPHIDNQEAIRSQPSEQPNASPFNLYNLDPSNAKEMMSNPLVKQLLSSPDFMKQMMNNPMMQKLKEKNPEISEILEDPEMQKEMQDIMSDPVKLDELMREEDSMMTQISNSPEALRMYEKLQYDMQEIQNEYKEHPDQFEDFAGSAHEAATRKPPTNPGNSTSGSINDIFSQVFGTPTTMTDEDYYPKPYTASLSGESRQGEQQNQEETNPLFEAGLPSNINYEQFEKMMNDPFVNEQVDKMLNNPYLFAQYMRNPMVSNEMKKMMPPEMEFLFNDPEQLRQTMIYARKMYGSNGSGMGEQNTEEQQEQEEQTPAYIPTEEENQARIEQLRQKYDIALETMKDLGCDFTEEEILTALDYCNGDCERAMNYLLDNE